MAYVNVALSLLFSCLLRLAEAQSPPPLHGTLYDPRYTEQDCPRDLNQYASLSISSDLLRQTLTFTLDFDTLDIHSCYLCQTRVNATYCGNNTGLINASDLTLSNDLSFNLLIAVAGGGVGPDPAFTSSAVTYFAIETIAPGSTIFQLDVASLVQSPPPGVSCDQPLRLIVVPILSLTVASLVYPIDVVTMMRDDSTADTTVACNDSARVFREIGCVSVQGVYSYVTLDTPNCVAQRVDSVAAVVTPPPDTLIRGTVLYWYVEALRGSYHAHRFTGGAAAAADLSLCGQSYLSLLRDTNQTLYCGTHAQLYVRQTAWVRLALQVVAAQLTLTTWPNDVSTTTTIRLDILSTVNLLERACPQRTLSLDAVMAPTAEALYMRLLRFNDGTNTNVTQQTLCETVARILNRSAGDMDSGFVPVYLSYWDEWFFHYFQYVVLYYATLGMRTRVIILLVLMVIACLSCIVFAFIMPTWICLSHWCTSRCKRNRKQARRLAIGVEYQML